MQNGTGCRMQTTGHSQLGLWPLKESAPWGGWGGSWVVKCWRHVSEADLAAALNFRDTFPPPQVVHSESPGAGRQLLGPLDSPCVCLAPGLPFAQIPQVNVCGFTFIEK